MVQPLLWLDKDWSQASRSVGGLPVAIVLPVLEAISLVSQRSGTFRSFLTTGPNIEMILELPNR